MYTVFSITIKVNDDLDDEMEKNQTIQEIILITTKFHLACALPPLGYI